MPHTPDYLIAVYLILKRGNEVLLSKRKNTGYFDGYYSLPAGHVDDGEKITEAVIREAREEIGVDIQSADLRFAHVMQKSNLERRYINFSFVCEKWEGEIRNCEEEKCEELLWCKMDELPPNVIFQVRSALENMRKGNFFSEYYEDLGDVKGSG